MPSLIQSSGTRKIQCTNSMDRQMNGWITKIFTVTSKSCLICYVPAWAHHWLTGWCNDSYWQLHNCPVSSMMQDGCFLAFKVIFTVVSMQVLIYCILLWFWYQNSLNPRQFCCIGDNKSNLNFIKRHKIVITGKAQV